MIEDIDDEVKAINSIYGEDTFRKASIPSAPEDYLLAIPQHEVTIRLWIPSQYPAACLRTTAVEGVGSTSQKGYGNHVLETARQVVQGVFVPGQVCIFDLLQELEQRLDEESATEDCLVGASQKLEDDQGSNARVSQEPDNSNGTIPSPQWTVSNSVTEKKSVFLARACAITSTLDVQSAVMHLLSTDKRAGKATHNISAFRIRAPVNGNDVVYQDYDDDGEDAAGGRLLKLLQMMNAWNVLVVVSRWYGGVKLGPARFGIINGVAREVIVAGDF
ncbi:MAG: hypothetical protein Q9186_007653, partial [Xanthomendoza sp. 1 TL-2023]